jgi:hypothetical protein
MKKLLVPPSVSTSFDGNCTETAKLPWLRSRVTTEKDVKKVDFVPQPIFDDGLDYSQEKLDHPREPDMVKSLRSSKINQIRKAIAFHPYKSTHPDLLEQLYTMINQGLKSITSNIPENKDVGKVKGKDTKVHDDEKLYLIYSTAFQVYINDSTIYQKFLSDVKSAYDNYISYIVDELKNEASRSLVHADKEIAHQVKVKEMEETHSIQIKQLQAQIKKDEFHFIAQEQQRQRVESEANKIREDALTKRKEYEESKASCVVLTSSLSRMEEEIRNYQNQENVRIIEVTNLRSTEQKLNEEINR